VVLQGQKGSITLAMTNEFGEFQFIRHHNLFCSPVTSLWSPQVAFPAPIR